MNKIFYNHRSADKVLGFLTGLYVTTLLANVAIGYRYVSVFGIDLAGGIFIFPISFIIGDIISEVYDSHYAKSLIFYGIICQIVFSLYIYLIIRMPHPIFWHNQKKFFEIMDPYLRFTLASSIAIIFGSWLNIHFLSKWSKLLHGRYFMIRSLGASFIGELFVTVSSMILANFGKMNLKQLVYMIVCCFSAKTLVSILAVWPAALIVCLLKKKSEPEKEKVKAKKWFRDFLFRLRQFSKPGFRLERINIESKKASIYCRGARVTIEQDIADIILNPKIIHNMNPIQCSYIGYYYGQLYDPAKSTYSFLSNPPKKSGFLFYFKKSQCFLFSILRDGNVCYSKGDETFIKNPIEIYQDHQLLEKFDSSQACYIGILVGLSQERKDKFKRRPNNLRLVVNNIKIGEIG